MRNGDRRRLIVEFTSATRNRHCFASPNSRAPISEKDGLNHDRTCYVQIEFQQRPAADCGEYPSPTPGRLSTLPSSAIGRFGDHDYGSSLSSESSRMRWCRYAVFLTVGASLFRARNLHRRKRRCVQRRKRYPVFLIVSSRAVDIDSQGRRGVF